MARRRLKVIAAALGLAIAVPVMAQVPPELFGGSEVTQDDLDKNAFYDAPDSAWFQSAPRDKNGLGCIVSFIAGKRATAGGELVATDSFGIMGPVSAKQMEIGMGMVIFTGSRIPRAAPDESEARITILSDEAPNKTKAMHMNNGEWSMFAVPVYVNQMIDASNPKESIGIEFEGQEVYRVNIVEYNNARTMLRNCMANYKGNRGK
jgi:hypothetical protein